MNKLLLLLFSVCLLSACKNASSKKDKSFDNSSKDSSGGVGHAIGGRPASGSGESVAYNIDAPDGWTKTDTIIMGTRITFIKSHEEKNDNFLENVNVVSEDVRNFSLNEYVEKSLAMMKSGLHDFNAGPQLDKSINGIDFKNFKYSHIYNGIPLDVDVYFAINNKTGYVITCTTTEGSLSKWQPAFDKIINSFSFN